MGSLRGEWLCWARRHLPGEATITLHRMESTKIKTSLRKAEKLVAVEENEKVFFSILDKFCRVLKKNVG